jgi:hypothetical protein
MSFAGLLTACDLQLAGIKRIVSAAVFRRENFFEGMGECPDMN